MITNGGRHIQIVKNRVCAKCKAYTDQICHKVRYQQNSGDAATLVKKSCWICTVCLNEVLELTEHRLPGDKARIINRLLGFQEDYAIQSMNIASQAEKLIVKIIVKD